jgi:hypothetical protein
LNAIRNPGAGGALARRLVALLLLSGPALAPAAGPAGPHDNVQTRAECASAASSALGEHALVFEDPPQADPPRPTELASEYYWRARLVGGNGPAMPVWLHCEIVPGATATHAEVLLRN